MTRIFASARTWRAVLLVLVVVVGYLALTPTPPRDVTLGWDKLNHGAAFAALALSGCLGFRATRTAMLRVTLALIAYGGLIEVVQLFVPGRSSEWGDLLADVVGVAAGALLSTWMRAHLRRDEGLDG